MLSFNAIPLLISLAFWQARVIEAVYGQVIIDCARDGAITKGKYPELDVHEPYWLGNAQGAVYAKCEGKTPVCCGYGSLTGIKVLWHPDRTMCPGEYMEIPEDKAIIVCVIDKDGRLMAHRLMNKQAPAFAGYKQLKERKAHPTPDEVETTCCRI